MEAFVFFLFAKSSVFFCDACRANYAARSGVDVRRAPALGREAVREPLFWRQWRYDTWRVLPRGWHHPTCAVLTAHLPRLVRDVASRVDIRRAISDAASVIVFFSHCSTDFNVLKTVWPSGLRRWLKAPVRKGVGSNPAAVARTGSSVVV